MEKIAIQPVQLGLNLGEAHFVAIHVNYFLGSSDVVLNVIYYDSIGLQLNASPHQLLVTQEVIESWNLNFAPVREWVLNTIEATPLQ